MDWQEHLTEEEREWLDWEATAALMERLMPVVLRRLAEARGKLVAVQRAVDAASDSGQYSLALVEIGAILDLEAILSLERKEGE